MFKFLKLLSSEGPKYSLKKMLVIWISSLLALTGAFVLYSHLYLKHQKKIGSPWIIEGILQTSNQPEALKSMFFAERLALSCDDPTPMESLCLNQAREILLETSFIKEVFLKKMKPNVLYIDYELREPIAFLGDYTNTVLDGEGFCFPFSPFFSPKRLPVVYLGKEVQPSPWGRQVSREIGSLIQDIFMFFGAESIAELNLSEVGASSAGRREIVVTLKKGTILRLSPKNFSQQLTHYLALKKSIPLSENAIIDLRLPDLAFIHKTSCVIK